MNPARQLRFSNAHDLRTTEAMEPLSGCRPSSSSALFFFRLLACFKSPGVGGQLTSPKSSDERRLPRIFTGDRGLWEGGLAQQEYAMNPAGQYGFQTLMTCGYLRR